LNELKEYYLNTNNINEWVEKLEKGDRVYLSGTIFTARDAAHKKLVALLEKNEPLPFELMNSIIYYAGPTPAKNKLAIGSIGPTTSSRMDCFTPLLLDNGLKAMIGKGGRNKDVVDSMVKNKAVYFAAVGGAGALYSGAVTSCEVIAFEELGCESVKKLTIKDFPVTVAIDSLGNSLFER
jgi:fumarate hydratase subunit beta